MKFLLKQNKKNIISSFLAFLFLCFFGLLNSAIANPSEVYSLSNEVCSDGLFSLGQLPVQDNGRIKPFDSFARESLQLIYGKQTFKKKLAVEIVFTWMLLPDAWKKQKIVQVRHNGLRKALNLGEEIYHSLEELMSNRRLGILFQELRSKQEREEKLNSYFQAVNTLNNQILVFHGISQGTLVKIWPSKKSKTWSSVSELENKAFLAFQKIVNGFLEHIKGQELESSSDQKEAELKLSQAVIDFTNLAYSNHKISYAEKNKIKLETHYNKWAPNIWAWLFLLLAAVFFAVIMVSKDSRKIQKQKIYSRLAWGFVGLGLLAMAYGMALRTLIMDRPPVTNMYETVIWVPFVTLICAIFIERIYKYTFVILSACLVSVFCLILSGLAPAVLDARLTPLEPVLRDNFWLITHVIMIVSSYGAFFLAFAIGDMMLLYYLKDENKYKKEIKKGVNAIYRSVQVGIVLLAGGTILGGIWADYSWGRFWGWDPKETWAFIALMGYLALLHGRLSGWFKDFAMVIGSVLAFLIVIMAWYGVNFVLGAGLHSYGFGAGGVEYVSAFAALHLGFVIYVSTLRWNRKREK